MTEVESLVQRANDAIAMPHSTKDELRRKEDAFASVMKAIDETYFGNTSLSDADKELLVRAAFDMANHVISILSEVERIKNESAPDKGGRHRKTHKARKGGRHNTHSRRR